MWVQFQLGVKYPTLLGVIIPWLYRYTHDITATAPPRVSLKPQLMAKLLQKIPMFCWYFSIFVGTLCPLNDGKNRPPRASISRQPEEFVRSTPQRPVRSVANLPIKIGEFPGKEELINQNGD